MIEVNTTPLGAFLLGQQLRRNLAAVREPVAYLYNGVRLPALPSVGGYDNAYIGSQNLSSGAVRYYVYFSTQPFFVKDSGFCGTENAGMCVVYLYVSSFDDFSWVEYESFETNADSLCRPPLWANYDMNNADGTVYLPKSDPVPIYE